MGKKTIHRRMNLDYFERYHKMVKENGAEHIVERSGMTKKIVFPNGIKWVFTGGKGKFMKGGWLVQMVEKDVALVADQFKNEKAYYYVNMFNEPAIEANIDKELMTVDLKNCYFRAAYNCGAISDRTFNKAYGNPEMKKAMVASLGALVKNKMVDEYKDGKLVRSYQDKSNIKKHKGIHNHIINIVHDCAMDIANTLGKDFAFWLTDCAYITPEGFGKIIKVLKRHNFDFKTSKIKILNFAGHIVWDDYGYNNIDSIVVNKIPIENIKKEYKEIKEGLKKPKP
jgi:hypothetical protein